MRLSRFIPTIVLFILASLLTGCTTTEYTLYLQDVNIKGPVSQPPVHITNNNMEKRLRISPHITFDAGSNRTLAGQLDGHSNVDARGRYRVDTIINSNNTVSFRETAGANTMPFTGKNLHWTTPSSSFGVDVDYTMSNHWALSLGTTYSTVEGNGLWGYRFGLGLFSEQANSALRVDGGVSWQELLYTASTAIVKRRGEVATPNDEVGFFRDKGKSMPMDFYGALTFNTKHQDWFTNIFFQVGLSKQSLAKFKPSVVEPVFFPLPFPVPPTPLVVVHDQRAEFSSTSLVITPGVYFDFDPTVRVLVGARINHQTQIKESSPDTMVLPFLQLDWML
jgi:hypothetical protein